MPQAFKNNYSNFYPYPMNPDIITFLIQECATLFQTTPEGICSPNRKRGNVLARNVVTDIAYNDFKYKYKEIGAVLKRDHSTLIANKYSYEQDMVTIPQLKYMRRQVFNKAQDYLLQLYGGYICE